MKNHFTKQDYNQYVEQIAPKSKTPRNVARAFVVGGVICIIGQFIYNAIGTLGLEKEMVSGITSVILVFTGALLTGLNIYDDIGRFAGGGSIVPITGFANSIVSPAMEFKSEGYVTGVGAKMFVIAGPVIVYGVATSVIVGILHYLIK